MADMAPRHGLICCLSGRLMRRRDTDCSRIGLSCVEAPLAGIVVVVGKMKVGGLEKEYVSWARGFPREVGKVRREREGKMDVVDY